MEQHCRGVNGRAMVHTDEGPTSIHTLFTPVLKDIAVQAPPAPPVCAWPREPPRARSLAPPESPTPDAFLKVASVSSYRTLSSTALPSASPTPTTSKAGEAVMVRTGEDLIGGQHDAGGGDG